MNIIRILVCLSVASTFGHAQLFRFDFNQQTLFPSFVDSRIEVVPHLQNAQPPTFPLRSENNYSLSLTPVLPGLGGFYVDVRSKPGYFLDFSYISIELEERGNAHHLEVKMLWDVSSPGPDTGGWPFHGDFTLTGMGTGLANERLRKATIYFRVFEASPSPDIIAEFDNITVNGFFTVIPEPKYGPLVAGLLLLCAVLWLRSKLRS